MLTYGNIKCVVRLDNSAAAPMETMTNNRVYVTLSSEGKPKYISYYDKENKRKKQIDLDKPHHGVSPHTHHGYEHKNDTSKGFAHLTPKEKDMVSRINKIWKEKKDVAWTKWKKHD